MLHFTISDLLNGKLNDLDATGHFLYIVRDNDRVFYIGQSTSIICRLLEHLGQTPRGLNGQVSPLGRLIKANLPQASWWQLTFLTLADCEVFVTAQFPNHRRWDIDTAEQALIATLGPRLNKTHIDSKPLITESTDVNPAAVYLAGLSAGSRETMARALDVIAEIASAGNADRLQLAWSKLTLAETAAIRRELASRYAPATVNRMLVALRGVLKRAWQSGQLSEADYRRITDLPAIAKEPTAAGRYLSPADLAALLQACGPDPAGVRDAAIIGLLYCGLSRSEIVELNRSDLGQDCKEIQVHGQRNSPRIIPLISGTIETLTDWLAVRGDEPGSLFLRIRRGGHIKQQQLTARSINHIVAARAEAAGLENVTPHDFRRALIRNLLEAGAGIGVVAELVGHASVAAVRRYDHGHGRARQRATNLVHLPYTRRTL